MDIFNTISSGKIEKSNNPEFHSYSKRRCSYRNMGYSYSRSGAQISENIWRNGKVYRNCKRNILKIEIDTL